MPDDLELLRCFAETGTEEAFTELVRRYVDLVYSAALRRVGGDAHLAKDVCQEVFVALARNARSLLNRRGLAGWLFTACRFAAAETVRRERRRRAREQSAHVMQESNENPTSSLHWEQLRPILDELMDRLPRSDREALLMRYFQQRKIAEICTEFGLTEAAARKRIDRALEKLRTMLSRRQIGSTATALATILSQEGVIAAPPNMVAVISGPALASVGVAGSALNLLIAMSNTKLAVAAALFAGTFAIGLATREVYRARSAETALTSAIHERDGQLAQLRNAKLHTQPAKGAGKRSSEGGVGVTRLNDTPIISGNAFLSAHPEVKQALLGYARAKVAGKYGAFEKKLQLTPVQIEQFETLMLEREGAKYSRGPTSAPLQLDASAGMSPAEIQTGLQAILGDEGLQQLQEYKLTLPARAFASQIASALYLTDKPLTAEQSDRLIEVMNNQGISLTGSRFTAAQSVLSPQQQTVLTDLQAQAAAQAAVAKAMRNGISSDKPWKD